MCTFASSCVSECLEILLNVKDFVSVPVLTRHLSRHSTQRHRYGIKSNQSINHLIKSNQVKSINQPINQSIHQSIVCNSNISANPHPQVPTSLLSSSWVLSVWQPRCSRFDRIHSCLAMRAWHCVHARMRGHAAADVRIRLSKS